MTELPPNIASFSPYPNLFSLPKKATVRHFEEQVRENGHGKKTSALTSCTAAASLEEEKAKGTARACLSSSGAGVCCLSFSTLTLSHPSATSGQRWGSQGSVYVQSTTRTETRPWGQRHIFFILKFKAHRTHPATSSGHKPR